MTIDRALAIYREQRINELLRPYAEAIAQGYGQAITELEADREQAAFDAAREVEHRASMEQRVTRTPLGVTFELRPGDTDELLWAAKRVLHGESYNPNGGFYYRQPTGGGSLRGWQISGGYRGD